MPESSVPFQPAPEKPIAASVPDIANRSIQVRKIAQQRLSSLSKLDPVSCKEVYLFQKDHFCGIRISLGPFRAIWRIENPTIQFFRGQSALGELAIDSRSDRQAA